ncbi:MAG: hypothetical protein LKF64_06205 [Alcaligenes faecalis]|jgi:hypothetical protein|nr:hypothetical protein [Alcaligenes faecalis]
MTKNETEERWQLTVEPKDDFSQDGVINLPRELSDKLAGKDIPYTLESDRSITLHISKAAQSI